MIDTLRYTKELQQAGLSPEQAELMVRNHFLMISDHVATKADFEILKSMIREQDLRLNGRIGEFGNKLNGRIDELGNKLNGRIDELDNRLSTKIDELDNRLNTKIDGLENKLIIKLGAITIGSITLLTAFQSALIVFLQK